MPTILVEAELSIEKLIEAAGQLSQPELERFVSQVLALQAQRSAPSLSVEESAFLMTINSGLSEEMYESYRKLIEKRGEGNLTEEEHSDLLRMSDENEQRQANRLEALAKLARLRNTSLDDLMGTLGIQPAAVE